MAKQSQLEKAIASIDGEIAVLQAAKQRLVNQQQAVKKSTRKPRAVVGPMPPAVLQA